MMNNLMSPMQCHLVCLMNAFSDVKDAWINLLTKHEKDEKHMGFLEWSIANRDQILYFSMCLSIPSILLYCAEIITIIRHKQYHSSFNKLFVIRAIPDLLYVLNSFYSYRLTTIFGNVLYPIYSMFPNWMITFDYFIGLYAFQANNLATIFMLLNRLTAIAMPVQHKQLWDKFLPAVPFIVYGVPLLDSWPMFRMNAGLLKVNANSTTDLNFMIHEEGDRTYGIYSVNIECTFAIIFLISCTIINIFIVLAYKTHAKNSNGNNANNANHRIELKLFVYALVSFFGHVLLACVMFCFYYAFTTANLVMSTVLPIHFFWIMDTGTVVLSSWLLLWAAESFRQQLFKDFGVPCIHFRTTAIHVTTLVGSGTSTVNVNGIAQRHSRIN